MRLPRKNSRRWKILGLFILGLAVAVFAWGLRYKTSLYNSGPASSHMLAAKMLSNRERPADTAVQVERATAPMLLLTCAIFALYAGNVLDFDARSRWSLQQVRVPLGLPIAARSLELFFRPPPRP